MYASQRVDIIEIDKKAHIDVSNEIILGMQNRIVELSNILEATLASITANVEYKKLQTKLNSVEMTIKKLEEDLELYKMISDKTKPNRFAPELDLAIKIWQGIYIYKKFGEDDDSHNKKFKTVAEAFGLREEKNMSNMYERIRIVTTPQKNKEVSTKKSKA